jgi:phosphopantetheine adenylyltransferase
LILDAHLKLINHAKKLGEVTVGILTDQAICEFKQLPNLDLKKELNYSKILKT